MAQPPTPPAGAAPGPPMLESPANQRRSRRWWFVIPIALFVYLFLSIATFVQPVSIAGLSLTAPLPGLWPARVFGLPDRPFTIAIVGLDVRPDQDGPARTDSILLLSIDPGANRAGILSIPRDAMMQIPVPNGGFVVDRVNTAYVYNWSRDDRGRAPAALAQTIEHNLGLRVDHYIVFDQRDAAAIIDSAGGVTVQVRQAFGQDNYSDDDVNVVPQFFPEGAQRLDGYQAVAYGRIREGSSDLDRIVRQQQVAEALVQQLSSPGNFFRIPSVWNAYRGAVDTSLSVRQSAGVLVLLKHVGMGRTVTRSLGDATVSCRQCFAALLQLRPDETARLIGEAFGDAEAGRAAAELLVAAGVTP